MSGHHDGDGMGEGLGHPQSGDMEMSVSSHLFLDLVPTQRMVLPTFRVCLSTSIEPNLDKQSSTDILRVFLFSDSRFCQKDSTMNDLELLTVLLPPPKYEIAGVIDMCLDFNHLSQ